MEGTLDQVLASALWAPLPCGLSSAGETTHRCGASSGTIYLNTLAVRPGTVMVYQRNAVTNDILYRAGVNLLEIPRRSSRGRAARTA